MEASKHMSAEMETSEWCPNDIARYMLQWLFVAQCHCAQYLLSCFWHVFFSKISVKELHGQLRKEHWSPCEEGHLLARDTLGSLACLQSTYIVLVKIEFYWIYSGFPFGANALAYG